MGMAAKAGRREGAGSYETGDNGSGAVKELCKNKFTLSSIDNYLLGLIT